MDDNVFCMKDKDFVLKLMSTYDSLTEKPNQKKTQRWFKSTSTTPVSVKHFKYMKPFANHYFHIYCTNKTTTT